MERVFKIGDRVWYRHRTVSYKGPPLKGTVVRIGRKRGYINYYRVKLDIPWGGHIKTYGSVLEPIEALDQLAEI